MISHSICRKDLANMIRLKMLQAVSLKVKLEVQELKFVVISGENNQIRATFIHDILNMLLKPMF